MCKQPFGEELRSWVLPAAKVTVNCMGKGNDISNAHACNPPMHPETAELEPLLYEDSTIKDELLPFRQDHPLVR